MFSRFKTYHIFVSHSWRYKQQYDTIFEWLHGSNISLSNYSIPQEKAFPKLSEYRLKQELSQQIALSSVIVVIAGGYIPYSEWLQFEVSEAARLGKPILAIKPFGNDSWPSILKQFDNVNYVNWNSTSFISALKALL